MNLRTELPDINRSSLLIEARRADEVIKGLGLAVPCAINAASRRLLYRAIRAMGARRVLDIGTFCGTSAAVFAQAVGPEGHVVSVDVADANGPDGFWTRSMRRPPREALAEAGLEDRVTFVRSRSDDFLMETDQRFDFISIDGWHEAFAAYTDILLSLGRLNPEGLIFVDDVQQPGAVVPEGLDVITGPYQALLWHENRGTGFRVVFNAGAMTAFLLRAV